MQQKSTYHLVDFPKIYCDVSLVLVKTCDEIRGSTYHLYLAL